MRSPAGFNLAARAVRKASPRLEVGSSTSRPRRLRQMHAEGQDQLLDIPNGPWPCVIGSGCPRPAGERIADR
jgi:hypothetical protein